MDLSVSAFMIAAVLSWLIPLLGIWIKLDSRGPVFFRQIRTGRNGRRFSCLKFRTMRKNAEADERPAMQDDERITSVGRFLRKTNIDELPQFINVLLGQMSVVGPRPHMPSDCIRFTFVIPSYPFRQLMKPGITGWAQVKGFHGITKSYESIALRYYWDAQYIRRASLWIDLRIMLSTFLQGMKNLFQTVI